jgi:ubiquinone/menaquinone biosynthesis C-methylase UbiE
MTHPHLAPPTIVRSDFDRLALLSEEYGWNNNDHYHGFLLKHVPAPCKEALDIGCGTGAFSRLLAERCERVQALDLSPEMVRIARERSRDYTNIDFQVADVLTWDFPVERFDCIVSIATLHHLPMETVLTKMRDALQPGGTLLVLDLFKSQTLSDWLVSALAVPVSLALKLAKSGKLREPPEIRQAWAEHGKHDVYPTLSQVRRLCTEVLPGARVSRHLFWRYSVVWRKQT